MKKCLQMFVLALLMTNINTLYSYNYWYGKQNNTKKQNNTPFKSIFSHSVPDLIAYITKDIDQNKYQDISNISTVISEILSEIWSSITNNKNPSNSFNRNPNNSNNTNNHKSSLYKKLNSNFDNTLIKNFKFNVSCIGGNNITVNFTHIIESTKQSDYTLYFIFKDNELFCKIVNTDIYRIIALKYNFQDNRFKKLKSEHSNQRELRNNPNFKNLPIPSYQTLYDAVLKTIRASILPGNTINATNSSKYIATKIFDIVKALNKSAQILQENDIQKTVWEIVKNFESDDIEVYDYSTDMNNINICFSINKVCQISLVICNNNITLVSWNISKGTMEILMFYKEKQKFDKISLNALEKLNNIPSENSLKELISSVMNSQNISHRYISNYIAAIPHILNFIKTAMQNVLSVITAADNDHKKLKQNLLNNNANLKALLNNNIDLKMNSKQEHNVKTVTFCFFIKDVFSIKFIITENNTKPSLEICLSKLFPATTYIFEPQTQKFKEK